MAFLTEGGVGYRGEGRNDIKFFWNANGGYNKVWGTLWAVLLDGWYLATAQKTVKAYEIAKWNT